MLVLYFKSINVHQKLNKGLFNVTNQLAFFELESGDQNPL